jgi:hypothetical protein
LSTTPGYGNGAGDLLKFQDRSRKQSNQSSYFTYQKLLIKVLQMLIALISKLKISRCFALLLYRGK